MLPIILAATDVNFDVGIVIGGLAAIVASVTGVLLASFKLIQYFVSKHEIAFKEMSDATQAVANAVEALTTSSDRRMENEKKQIAVMEKQIQASKEARKASNEVLTFMKKLNGKLQNAVIQKVAEQNVEHQTVNSVEIITPKE